MKAILVSFFFFSFLFSQTVNMTVTEDISVQELPIPIVSVTVEEVVITPDALVVTEDMVEFVVATESMTLEKTATKDVATKPGITVVGKRIYDRTGLSSAATVVLSSEEIRENGYETLYDILQNEIGLIPFNMTGSNMDQHLNFRGFNTGKDLIVVIDGVKINEPDENDVYWFYIPVTDIDTIEIVKGSNSSVYGGGAFAGIINIRTLRNKEKYLDLEVGSYGFARQELKISDFFNDYYYSLVYGHKATDGYREKSDYDLTNVSGKIGKLEDGKETFLEYKSFNSQMKYADSLTEDEMVADRTQESPNSWDSRNVVGHIIGLAHDQEITDDWKLSLNLSQKEREAEYFSVARGAFGTSYQKDISSVASQVLQLNYRDNYILGLELIQANIDAVTYGLDKPTRKKTTKSGHIVSGKSEQAFFATYYGDFKDVYLRASVRFDDISYDPFDKFNNVRKEDKKFMHKTHSYELGYNIFSDLSLFASYGEAFRAPTFFNMYYTAWGANEDLESELSKTMQYGLSADFGRLKMKLINFSSIVDDEIAYITEFVTFTGMNQNLQSTKRWGNEFSIDYLLTDELTLSAGLMGMFSVIEEGYYDNWVTFQVDDISGYKIPMVPEESYNIGLNYKKGKNRVKVVHYFVGEQYMQGDIYNTEEKLKPYNYTNVYYEGNVSNELTTYVSIYNLFNNLYSTRAVTSEGTSYYNPADLRALNLGVRWLF